MWAPRLPAAVESGQPLEKRWMIKNANSRESCDYFGLAIAMDEGDFRVYVRGRAMISTIVNE